jgi:pimeloyl-ACP methyl ester carboxylesterase
LTDSIGERQAVKEGVGAVTTKTGPLATERLSLPSLDLEVIRGGAGQPILLLHGPFNFSPQAPFLQLLSKEAAIIAPSHPGFGNSPRPGSFDTVYDLVHLYQDLLDELPHTQVTLIGFSFGGWIAAELAINYAHRLDRLILVDPVGLKIGGRETRDIVHLFNTSPAELGRRGWHDPAKQRPGQFGLGWQQHLEAMSDAELVTAARNWDALCLYAWRPHLYNPQLNQWLHRIRLPTLLLWGASDQIVRPSYGQAYSQLIPGSRLEIIPEAGHHPEQEQPAAVVEQILRFIAS